MATRAQLAELERNWLAAEAVADELKHEAARIRSSASDSGNAEVTVILKHAEELEAKHVEAEQAASDAFDQLWQARNGSDAAPATEQEVRAA
jgi:hypothetical protein